jgi:hypothetical protein
VAAHSTIAKGGLHTPAEVVAAVRDNTRVPDAKLNALVTLVRELVRERGYAKDKTIQKFLAAGYTKEQVMELLLGIALKTISNCLDHIRRLRLIWHSQPRTNNLARSEKSKPPLSPELSRRKLAVSKWPTKGHCSSMR